MCYSLMSAWTLTHSFIQTDVACNVMLHTLMALVAHTQKLHTVIRFFMVSCILTSLLNFLLPFESSNRKRKFYSTDFHFPFCGNRSETTNGMELHKLYLTLV